MSGVHQKQAEDLYRAALERPAAERLAYIAKHSVGDVELRQRVLAMLAQADATEFRPSGAGVASGTVIGVYRVDGLLAKGGMGVVCAATDTILGRRVAIKFLSEGLFDADARRRFQREAQMASSLNHPHILTVHAAGEHEGQQYLVTEYVDGGTLSDWMQRREPRGWRQCAELLIGVADGLAAAHTANILHRDIKPANILITKNGYAKLADFGIAKLTADRPDTSDAHTTRGMIIGTVAYMSPEQAAGAELDARSDIFSFGVVLYEVLSGRRPFEGSTDLELLQHVVHSDPAPLPENVPEKLRAIVEKALQKDPAERYQTMRDLVVDVRHVVRQSGEHRDIAPVERPPTAVVAKKSARPNFLVFAAVAAVLAVLAAAGWSWQRRGVAEQARTETIPAIAAQVDQGDYVGAFARAQEVRRYVRNDAMLTSLTPLFTATYSLTTTPPDAEVFVRGYDAMDDEWQNLGRTPLANIQVARRPLRWRIEKPGYEPVELATPVLGDANGFGAFERTLQAVGAQPPDMVYVPGGALDAKINRLPLEAAELAPFLIDRYEVSNKAYKEFVDAGGYERRVYWDGFEWSKDGQPLSFDAAMRLFVDATGRPGPATWELGTYADGRSEYPVTGISWYEAAAYARYRGKSLPTVFHWIKAALPPNEGSSSLASEATSLSNFSTAGPAPVGKYQGVGPYGTYDMFGNVREWCLNLGPFGGWVVGGSWDDPDYFYNVAASMPLLERSRLTGLRLMQYAGDHPDAASLQAELDLRPQNRNLTPVPDEVFATYLAEFAYTSGKVNATMPATIAENDYWVKQRVTIDAGYNDERLDLILFVPKRARPPFHPIILLNGIGIVMAAASSDSVQTGSEAVPLDFIVKSGRMLVHPIFQGTYERFKAPYNPSDQVRTTREWIERRWDLGRTIDYLETRTDVDASRLGYVGVSFGASSALPLVAVEPRIKAAVFLSGGIPRPVPAMIVEPINYVPRIKIPVLMVNGRFDDIFAVESSQLPLFEGLGTPAEHKRHVILESGHGSAPRPELLRETLGWLDKYLGQVP